VNVAVTSLAASMVTWQSPLVLVQAPAQPAKPDPVSGLAFSVTGVPWPKSNVHVVLQSMPAGVLETEPVPAPSRETVSVRGIRLKVARHRLRRVHRERAVDDGARARTGIRP